MYQHGPKSKLLSHLLQLLINIKIKVDIYILCDTYIGGGVAKGGFATPKPFLPPLTIFNNAVLKANNEVSKAPVYSYNEQSYEIILSNTAV